ncbi:MAG: DUF2809 domain-containing protein [Phycisphaerae bacterium]
MQRSRILYTRLIAAGCAAAAVILGIAVRKLLPAGFWSKYAGVALWSMLAYALLVAAVPRWSVFRTALTALLLSWAVEFAQLTPVPAWLAARQPIFAWILGTSFSLRDLPAYAAGVALAAVVRAVLIRRRANA